MTYCSEHRRMEPVLDKARAFDIATNPDPRAIFEAGSGGFQIWYTPEDHPKGWEKVQLVAGAFSKPCGYVASVHWGWGEGADAEQITHLVLSTSAYDLRDSGAAPSTLRRRSGDESIENRPADLAWARRKIRWLFAQAGVPLPPIIVDRE